MNRDDYRRDFDKIHDQLEKLDNKLDDYAQRITKIETTQKGVVAFLALFITSGISAVYKFIG